MQDWLNSVCEGKGLRSIGLYFSLFILLLAYFLYNVHQRRREYEVSPSFLTLYPHLRFDSKYTGRRSVWQSTRLPAHNGAPSGQMAPRNRCASSTTGCHFRQPSLCLPATLH